MFVVKIRKLPSIKMPVFVGRLVVGFLPGSFRPKAECPTKSGILNLWASEGFFRLPLGKTR